ncbi:ATP-dependent DNA helicase Rep [Treponema bryantii]|uniref:DNA 3'-5' helicase n=1 Tax=Treponema bryantii TaxID=163 RepID=A0A1H9EU80_9SPIR|nr:UvrD-helicase domain-containing protein [Treponema bryantii]SEQ28548.1 ATP-dependent DNA helicase Rep [Treponema bryantii]
MTENNYLDSLNEEQRAAVVHEGSPLLILAGAGSGKTRVITTKIAYLIKEKNIDPWSILSVTFTKKAANEMRERAVAIDERAADAKIQTFHSFGAWFLRKYAEHAGLEPSFTVYDDDDVATLIKKAEPSLSTKEIRTAAHQISLAKDYCLTPEDDLSIIGSEFDLNDIYSKYQKRLRATGNADFGDLIMLPVQILEAYEEIADYIHNRFKVIMVDEYQDSNIAQYRLLQALSGVKQGSDTYVCVVGDDDQSIYKFRGAEVENILTFPEKFPGTEIIKLERNYRSTANILNAAGLVVKKNHHGSLEKTLVADREGGGKPVLAFLPDQNAEATFTADLVMKSLAGGAKYSDWAVMYRTNVQSRLFEIEFARRKIPYVVFGSLGFYEREEIKDALAYISFFANHKDEISFRRIINKPTRGIGDKTQDKLMASAVTLKGDGNPIFSDLLENIKNHKDSLSKKASEGASGFINLFDTLAGCFDENKPLSDFIERVIHDSGLDEYHKAVDEIEGTTRAQNLQELINSAVHYECTLDGLVKFLDTINLDRTMTEENEAIGDNYVTLITLHNTKGLEYNKVIITGLEEGVFPRMEKTGAELEEERRLFYVGITRARDELYVTSTAKRCLYGRWDFMRPSPFIKEAAEAFTVIGQAPFGFSVRKTSPYGQFGRDASAFSNTSDDTSEDDSLVSKWKKGTHVYHDDYGDGAVVAAYSNSGEYVIEVQFANGGKKKFLPKYQAKSLQVIKD